VLSNDEDQEEDEGEEEEDEDVVDGVGAQPPLPDDVGQEEKKGNGKS
jgi:hypothetical protein